MRFEDEEDEPVSVVRTLADWSMNLTLVVLMLIGTRSPTASSPADRSSSRAASQLPGAKKTDLTVVLLEDATFLTLPSAPDAKPMDGTALARHWQNTHSNAPASVVVQFPTKALAADLHRGLLSLQSAFGTNEVAIQTIPASPP